MWQPIGILMFLCSSGVVLAQDMSSDAILKTAYCMCKCCAKDKSSCVRLSSSANYECGESMCNENTCVVYEKARCKSFCFCNKCKSVLEKDDPRCATRFPRPANCECKEKIDCKKHKKKPEKLDKILKNKDDPDSECAIPCYCKNCKATLPPENLRICLETEAPDSHCKCETIKCPGPGVIKNLNKIRQVRKKREEEKDDSFNFSDEIDLILDPVESKAMKCRMKCQCSICADAHDNVQETCERLLPKPPIDCPECDPDKVNCRENTIDEQCRVYCFCKKCKDDSRIPFNYKKSCIDVVNKQIGCLCEGKGDDCGIIEKMSERGTESFKTTKDKKRAKKGKLKKKKQDRDEL
uniref:uncharacterized protein LOC120326848 n=1 Tax=Styela clava TaxID=7725 RepID=UPI00193ADF2B|nr:uncharacterized protein LOC120326848 [Styela clava]